MKKLSTLFLLTTISLGLIGCSSETITDKEVINFDIIFDDAFYASRNINFTYKGEYFQKSSSSFNEELALLSFGAADQAGYFDKLDAFYKKMGFENEYYPDYYKQETEFDNIAYYIASKKTIDSTLVAVTVRGSNYGKEWQSNFILGESGYHQGFYKAASKVYDSLKEYINKNNLKDNVKLWLNGYSRGGATINMVSHFVQLKKEINIPASNIYTYTFETPSAISQEKIQHFDNIFNVINSNDFIPTVPPHKYGLYREGVDINVYRDDINDILQKDYPDINLEEFKANEALYKNGEEYITFVSDTLFGDNGNEINISTRSKYVEYLQHAASFVIYIAKNIHSATLNRIMNDFKDKSIWDIVSYLDVEVLFNYFNPILKEDGVEYQESDLQKACSQIVAMANSLMLNIASILMSNASNIIRSAKCHAETINYALIKNYSRK